MLKELACVGCQCMCVCMHSFGAIAVVHCYFYYDFLAMLKLDKCAPFLAHPPCADILTTWEKIKREKHKNKQSVHRIYSQSIKCVEPGLRRKIQSRRCIYDKRSVSIIHQTFVTPLDPLIAHDCKQGSAKNLKKDESDPPLYEDHQSPAVSSLFISSSKAALFHFMDIMKAKMDISGKAV